jgi:DNA adenine methylase
MHPDSTFPGSAAVGVASMSKLPVRPFLKWAGGKRQLLPVLRRFYPHEFGKYLEPFVGSGAVFFDLYNQGLLATRQSVLVDSNPDLIGCYSAVRDNVEAVIRELRRLANEHARGGAEFFYEVRDREFNPARRAWSAEGGTHYPFHLAAMLIYLNRTGFNGLFRLNGAGEFNVPAGRYSNPQICDSDNLRRVAEALGRGVRLLHDSFEQIGGLAEAGDFLYFDPPYAPVSRTARFTSYTASQFGSREQQQLFELTVALAHRKCHVVISNSTAGEIQQLYDSPVSRRAGLRVHRVQAKRAINSNAALRGPVSEFILANTPASLPN